MQAAAARAAQFAPTVAPDDRRLLVAAAWLHDIGYSPPLIDTGLHSLDGARYLDRIGLPGRLCALVAHHSGARYEAAERGLTTQLDEYPAEHSRVADALTAADLTTGPDGRCLTVDERIDEILTRYPTGGPVHRAITTGRTDLIEQVRRALGRLERVP